MLARFGYFSRSYTIPSVDHPDECQKQQKWRRKGFKLFHGQLAREPERVYITTRLASLHKEGRGESEDENDSDGRNDGTSRVAVTTDDTLITSTRALVLVLLTAEDIIARSTEGDRAGAKTLGVAVGASAALAVAVVGGLKS